MSDLMIQFNSGEAADAFLKDAPGFEVVPSGRVLDAIYGPEPIEPDRDYDELSRSTLQPARFRGGGLALDEEATAP